MDRVRAIVGAVGIGAALLVGAAAPVAAQDAEEAAPMGMAMGAPAMGAPAMGAPAMGAPAMGAPAMGASMMAARMAADPEVAAARMEAREARMALMAARMMPAGEERAEAVEEARGGLEEAREEAREARAEAREEHREDRAGARGDRRERRRERWNALRGRLGLQRPDAIPPAVRAELRLHARRMARLRRIEALADDAGDDAAEARAGQLMVREQQRHQARMDALSGRAGAVEAEAEVE